MYVIYECTRIGREFVRENEFLKKIREGEWIFEIRREKERERKEEFLGKKSYWKSHLSLYLSLLINETNEKENVQELEENSKEREWIFEIRRERERGRRDFWAENRIGIISLSLSLSLSFDKWNERKKECTRVGKEFERERGGDFWVKNRIGRLISLWNERKGKCTRLGKQFERERVNFWNSKRERKRENFWAENYIERIISLSLSFSFSLDEWNEREGECTKVAREFEKEKERENEIRREREGGIFGQRIVLGEPDGAKLSIYLVACTIGSLAHEFYYSSLCAANRKAVWFWAKRRESLNFTHRNTIIWFSIAINVTRENVKETTQRFEKQRILRIISRIISRMFNEGRWM